MRIVWDFIQNQILGMKWLNELVGGLLTLCGVDVEGEIGGSIQFFIYDTVKIPWVFFIHQREIIRMESYYISRR